MNIKALKLLSYNEFHKLTDHTKESYNYIRDSKEGHIIITKLSDNPNKHISQGETRAGYTQAFGKGLCLYISTSDTYFRTSMIVKIDWKNEIFYTLNSKYSFKFQEDGKDIP